MRGYNLTMDPLTQSFVEAIKLHGVVYVIEEFRHALELLADPAVSENEEGFKAYVAVSQMDEVTGTW